MKYCQETTKSHPLAISNSNCLQKINDIIKNEGGNTFPFNANDIALNLDKVVIEKHLQNLCSMDMTIGISQNNAKKMLLIEFKLNYRVPKNISGKECKRKIQDSIKLLGQEIAISNTPIFIFKTNLLSQAKNILSRQLGIPKVEVLGIEDFRTNYF